MTKIKYPSLAADVEPAERDGHRGSLVRCTATRAELGFVWWSQNTQGVTWHWRSGDQQGERNTERNAVQALRDLSKGFDSTPPTQRKREALQQRLSEIFGDDDVPPHDDVDAPTTTTRTTPAPRVVVVKPAHVQQIVWGTNNTGNPGVTAAVQAAFKKHTETK